MTVTFNGINVLGAALVVNGHEYDGYCNRHHEIHVMGSKQVEDFITLLEEWLPVIVKAEREARQAEIEKTQRDLATLQAKLAKLQEQS